MSNGAKPSPSLTDSKTQATSPTLLTRFIVDAALSKKASDVAVMEMYDVSGVADYFVLCTGNSDMQIRAISDEVQFQVKEEFGERPWHREGVEHYSWVVLDYVDVVVHIMDAEKRGYYLLERLWGDARTEFVDNDGSSADIKLLEKVRQPNVASRKKESS